MVEWSDCVEKSELAKYRYGVVTTTHLSENDASRKLELGDRIFAEWPEERKTNGRCHCEAVILGIDGN